MQTDFLPVFLEKRWKEFTQELQLPRKANLLQMLFAKTIEFFGKLILLEYAQSSWKTRSKNFLLFAQYRLLPQKPQEWISLVRILLQGKNSSFVVRPLDSFFEKYPSVLGDNTEDRMARLLWFYKLVAGSPYRVSDIELEEAEEQMEDLLQYFQFLQLGKYREGVEAHALDFLFETDVLSLHPFFILSPGENAMRLDEPKDAALVDTFFEIGFLSPLREDLDQFYKIQSGKADFSAVFSSYQKNYVLSPWMEAFLEEIVKDAFEWDKKLSFGNIIFIEGYPGCGKTALAANLGHILVPQSVDVVLGYFLDEEMRFFGTQTLLKWMSREIKQCFSEGKWNALLKEKESLPKKILIFFDGIEHLPIEEYKGLLRSLKEYPFSQILFFFLERRHEGHPVEARKRLVIPWEENVFWAGPDAMVLQKWKDRYLPSALAQQIFQFLAQNQAHSFTASEIAQYLNIFNPIVANAIEKMKPLLEIMAQPQGPEKMRIFHPTIATEMLKTIARK